VRSSWRRSGHRRRRRSRAIQPHRGGRPPMTGHIWVDILIGVAVALLLTWVLLVVALAVGRPQGKLLSESIRLLPDLLRLLRRLAVDRSQPAGVRIRLGLLLIYLAMPI